MKWFFVIFGVLRCAFAVTISQPLTLGTSYPGCVDNDNLDLSANGEGEIGVCWSDFNVEADEDVIKCSSCRLGRWQHVALPLDHQPAALLVQIEENKPLLCTWFKVEENLWSQEKESLAVLRDDTFSVQRYSVPKGGEALGHAITPGGTPFIVYQIPDSRGGWYLEQLKVEGNDRVIERIAHIRQSLEIGDAFHLCNDGKEAVYLVWEESPGTVAFAKSVEDGSVTLLGSLPIDPGALLGDLYFASCQGGELSIVGTTRPARHDAQRLFFSALFSEKSGYTSVEPLFTVEGELDYVRIEQDGKGNTLAFARNSNSVETACYYIFKPFDGAWQDPLVCPLDRFDGAPFLLGLPEGGFSLVYRRDHGRYPAVSEIAFCAKAGRWFAPSLLSPPGRGCSPCAYVTDNEGNGLLFYWMATGYFEDFQLEMVKVSY